MVKGLTLGQYTDKNSAVHGLDSRLKFVYIILLGILVFMIKNTEEIIIFSVFMIFLMLISKISLQNLQRNLRAFYSIFIFILMMYLIFSRNQLNQGFLAIWRFLMLILISMAFTFTTKISDIITAIEKLTKPLKFFGIKPRNIATMISIAIRFVPSMSTAMEKTREAMISRLADFRKPKHIKLFMIVMLEKMLKSASNLSDAMQARLYNENIENKRIMNLKTNDYLSIAVLAILILIIY